jgi:hypothetical protein
LAAPGRMTETMAMSWSMARTPDIRANEVMAGLSI